jgi:hypothetical protein
VVFAELRYEGRYEDVHAKLSAFLSARFANVLSGLQGDSWIWVFDGADKVAVDTFTAMKHEVKSENHCPLVDKVIAELRESYDVHVYTHGRDE